MIVEGKRFTFHPGPRSLPEALATLLLWAPRDFSPRFAVVHPHAGPRIRRLPSLLRLYALLCTYRLFCARIISELMQRAAKQTRKVNRWNAYLHSQVEAFNQGALRCAVYHGKVLNIKHQTLPPAIPDQRFTRLREEYARDGML